MIYKNKLKFKQSLNLKKRNLLITNALISKKINIYKGKGYGSKIISKVDLGHKLGEFAFTRPNNPLIHVKKKIKKQLNKKKK